MVAEAMEGLVAASAVEGFQVEMAAGVGSEVASEATEAVGTPLVLGNQYTQVAYKFPKCTMTRIRAPNLA